MADIIGDLKNNTLIGIPEIDSIFGDVRGDLSGEQRGGNDRLFGGDNDDVLFGDAGFMRNDAQRGNDQLFAGDGNDLLLGDADSLFDDARSGSDGLFGGDGDDLFSGDADNSVGGDEAGVAGHQIFTARESFSARILEEVLHLRRAHVCAHVFGCSKI